MAKPKSRVQRKHPKETPMQAVLRALPKTWGKTRSGRTVNPHGQIHDKVLDRSGLAKVFRKQGFLFANDEHWLDRAYDIGQRLAAGGRIKRGR